MALDRRSGLMAPRELVRAYVLFGSAVYGVALAGGVALVVVGGTWPMVVFGLASVVVGIAGLTGRLRSHVRVFADRVEVHDGWSVRSIALGEEVECVPVQYVSPWTKGRVSPVFWMVRIAGVDVPLVMSSKKTAARRARALVRLVETVRRER